MGGLAPGILLSIAVTLTAMFAEHVEAVLAGRAWLEALVLAILFGAAVRTIACPPPRFEAGIQYAAKPVLEIAVALMGAAVSVAALRSIGLPLLTGIVLIVALAIAGSYALGRACGLNPRMAALVACGNAICGNSAIATVAPVIRANGNDVAVAISFTAVFGILVVLLMPALAILLGFSPLAAGALAGLTVYAVPQVLAAAAPLGASAVHFGTLVKLIRVLMLGPVVAVLSLLLKQRGGDGAGKIRHRPAEFLPWFILVFLILACLRSANLLPDVVVQSADRLSRLLTIIAMAGLGLSVDLRDVSAAGPRVAAVVILSLMMLTAMAVALLWTIGLV